MNMAEGTTEDLPTRDRFLRNLLALLNKPEMAQRKLVTPQMKKTEGTGERKEKIERIEQTKRKSERNNSGIITEKK
jgi:hypothetical protein